MKWFQHSTDSYNDPDISDAEDLFGDAGYSVFFKILEIYGREFNSINPDGFLNISKTFIRRKCRKSWTKVEQILNFYQTKNRIYYENDKDMISFCVPKFLEQSDNWTKRTKLNKPQNLQSNYRVTTVIEEEKEEKKKKKEKEPFLSPTDFNQFWNTYPRKVGKQECLKIWLNSKKKKARPSIDDIVKVLEIQKDSEDWTKENGRYIPNPSTWLNQGRWDDELREIQPEHNGIKTTTPAYPSCPSCGMNASSIKKGKECPFCGELA